MASQSKSPVGINLRGRDPVLRRAQAAAQSGLVRSALDHLKDHTIEVKGDGAVVAAEKWLGLSPAEREKTASYASGRAIRSAVNQAVQTSLLANGELGSGTMRLEVLDRINLTKEELRYLANYRPRQILDLQKTERAQKLKGGEYSVRAIDEKKGLVELEDRNGKRHRFNPSRTPVVEVFCQRDLGIPIQRIASSLRVSYASASLSSLDELFGSWQNNEVMNLIPCQRHRFSVPADIAYLNCAYMSPLANEVLAAVSAGAALKAVPWNYRPEDFFTHAERARGAFADVAGCNADAIALVPSASYGLAIAARNLPISKGQRILVLAKQFPSNVYVWRERAAEAGGTIETVTRGSGESWAAALISRIADEVAIVAVPNCHWADGSLVDLDLVGAACRRVGAALVVDATQSLGAMSIDLERVQPDFLVAAAYKWLMAPYGTGMLYVAPQHRYGIPIEHNWINLGGSEDFAGLVDYRDDFQAGARRYDMGERSNPPLLMGVVAAAEMLLEWGVEQIAATLEGKTDQIAERAGGLGLEVLEKAHRSPHLMSIRFPGTLPEGIGAQLATKGVYVSVRVSLCGLRRTFTTATPTLTA